jgi:AcrR family transcriptional regulator
VRTWGGQTAEERQAERRRKLLHAAYELWGEGGWAAVTMRKVCARAGLIDRYFYESFADRDALLGAVWDQVRDEATAAVAGPLTDAAREPVTSVRLATAALIAYITADPVRALILFGDHSGMAELEQRRHEMIAALTDIVVESAAPFLKPGVDLLSLRMSALTSIGGTLELLTAWRAGTIDVDAQRIVEHTELLARLLGAEYLSAEAAVEP